MATVEAANVEWPTFKPDAQLMKLRRDKFKTCVLTVDGGGLRGMLPARLLEVLEEEIKEVVVERMTEVLKKKANGPITPEKEANGPITLEVLTSRKFNIDIADYFDCMSGTSTGSIITTYLATKGEYSAKFLTTDKEMIALGKSDPKNYGPNQLRPGSCRAIQGVFQAKAKTIFPRKVQSVPIIGGITATFVNFVGAKYPAHGVDAVLKAVFGGDLPDPIRLSSALKTSLIIPTFQLNYKRTLTFWYRHKDGPEDVPKFGYATTSRKDIAPAGMAKDQEAGSAQGTSWMGKAMDLRYVPMVDFELWQVVRASTAAPTFFPVCKMNPYRLPKTTDGTVDMSKYVKSVKEEWRLVDGGITANNPAMAAVAFVTAAFKELKSLKQIAVLSLGCGVAVSGVGIGDGSGQIGWISPLVGMLMDGNSEVTSALVEHFVTHQYANSSEGGDKSARFIRIQKTVYHPDLLAQDSDRDPDTLDDVPDKPAAKGQKIKPSREFEALGQMDIPDFVPLYRSMADNMVQEENIRLLFRTFAKDYLWPEDLTITVGRDSTLPAVTPSEKVAQKTAGDV